MGNKQTRFEDLSDYLTQKAHHVLITFHKDPDLDAVGSSLAMAAYLNQIGKNVLIWSDGFENHDFFDFGPRKIFFKKLKKIE